MNEYIFKSSSQCKAVILHNADGFTSGDQAGYLSVASGDLHVGRAYDIIN